MQIIVDVSVMELPGTGIAKVVSGLYRSVSERDPAILITGVHRRPLVAPLPLSIRARRIAPYLSAPLWRRVALPRAARKAPRAILHFPWNGQIPRLAQTTRIVTTMHDVLPLLIPGYFAHEDEERTYRIERQNDIDRSSVIVTDSEFSKREIIRHFRVDREPIVIACATDIGALAPGSETSDPPYFLYVGGLDPRKSVDALLRVFLHMAAKGVLRSNLIVTGSRRHAPESITRLLDDGIRRGCMEHRGYVSEPELARLYAGATALVYPSMYEGFGMPPLEAMTLGCPVITCRTTSLPEICGEAAYYIEPGNDQSLAGALTALDRDPDLRRRLATTGQERSTLFSWDKAAEKFLTILEQLDPT